MGARRVVVTGTGVVTPIGNDVATFWSAMKEGKSGVGPLRDIDFPEQYVRDLMIQIACQVKDFDPKARIKNRLLLMADRYSQFAGAAAAEAFAQSKLETPLKNPYRSACIIGSGGGGLNTIEWAYNQLFTKNRRGNDPLMLLKFIGSSASAHVGIDYGIKGPTFGTVSACATATHAIGLMLRFIREGLVDVGIAGASESTINYGCMKAWQAIRVLSPEGCFPFSKKRNGTVLGEGAGLLVMEELEHAKARGANILAEVKGFGMASDAKDMINPDLEGPKEAMRQALEEARLSPSDIDYLNAHGTGTVSYTHLRARPTVRPRLRAQRRPQDADRARHVELVRFRWPQRGAGVRACARVTLVIPASAKRASGNRAEKSRSVLGPGLRRDDVCG